MVVSKAKMEYQVKRPESFRGVACDISASSMGMTLANAAHENFEALLAILKF
jgi:c-di-GMP-binding flagellar brake protein YcgR